MRETYTEVITEANLYIGAHPDGFVLRDSRGHEVSPVLSDMGYLQRWCRLQGYRVKGKSRVIKNRRKKC